MLTWLIACAPAPAPDPADEAEAVAIVAPAPAEAAAPLDPPAQAAAPAPLAVSAAMVAAPRARSAAPPKEAAPPAGPPAAVVAPATTEEPTISEEPAAAERPAPSVYALDPERSALFVVVRYDRSAALGAALGHDHAIGATGWSGAVRWNPDDVPACEVDVRVPVAGLVVNPEGARARAGLEGTPPQRDGPRIVENLRGKRQLDMASYADIRFRSTGCSGAPGDVRVAGDLTLRGVTRPVVIPMRITAADGALHAVGAFEAKTTDFGFDPFTNALGALRNAPDLAWTIDVRGAAAPPER